MSTPINIDTTLDASGNSNDTTEAVAKIRSEGAILQFEVDIGGPVDIHFDVRADERFSWRSYVSAASMTGVGAGEGDVLPVDIGDIPHVRVRVINQGSNSADVNAAVVTV